MTTLTKAAFAKHIGKNRAYVRQLENLGRLVMDGNNVDVEASLLKMDETKDPSKQGVVERHQAAREQKQDGGQSVSGASSEKDGAVYQKSKAMREQYNALLAKSDYELRIGKLLPIEDVKAAVADGDAVIRNRLESLPDIMAPQLAAEQDEQRIRLLLMDYIEQTLRELSRGFKELSKDLHA